MPVLTHPTEWPEATKHALTHKAGPLPVWAWGAVIVGAIVAIRVLGTSSKTPNNAVRGNGGMLPPGGTFNGYGGGIGGGGSSLTSSDTLAPASHGSGPSSGGVSGAPLGAMVPSNGNLVQDLTVQGTDAYAAMMRSGGPDLLAQGSVGPIKRIPGTSDAAWQQTQSVNMSLANWFRYQAAKGTPQTNYYGPTAGPEQRALEQAALAQSKAG